MNRAARRLQARVKKAKLNQRRKRIFPVLDLTENNYRLPKNYSPPDEPLRKCYAAALGKCGGKLSLEHYISKNILNQMGELKATGLPWMKDIESGTSVTAKHFAAKVLCQYHNNFLSPLDNHAGQAFTNFSQLNVDSVPNIIVYGPSLERFMLKTLTGMIAAKQEPRRTEVPEKWVRILFGFEDFANGQGLYMTPVVGQKMRWGKTFGMTTLFLNGDLQAIRTNLGGLEFTLTMASKDESFRKDHPSYDNILYRPQGFNLTDRPNRIVIKWN